MKDLKNKMFRLPKAERLRYSADPIFRTIKSGSTGFKIGGETYSYLIDNNKLDYILWSDKQVEKDVISLLEDKFLSTLLRVSRENNYDGKDSADFFKFIRLCRNASIIKSLFGINLGGNIDQCNSKEGVLLSIFGNKKEIKKTFKGNYIFENFYRV